MARPAYRDYSSFPFGPSEPGALPIGPKGTYRLYRSWGTGRMEDPEAGEARCARSSLIKKTRLKNAMEARLEPELARGAEWQSEHEPRL